MKGGRVSLRCVFNGRRRKCKAKASVDCDGDAFRPSRIGYHNHPPPKWIVYQRRFRTAVLNECQKEGNFNVLLKRLCNRVD
ncbi:ARS-binding factor 1 [Frankliniella fusca]|uniref:ARS-binding factor 1 n=1 Tax=Frankliniella fusca TaxID=407009 RepID=A0AAE1HFV6_9NEOP|nr:ARS-binding factor 1 [Frankliniella fusca]